MNLSEFENSFGMLLSETRQMQYIHRLLPPSLQIIMEDNLHLFGAWSKSKYINELHDVSATYEWPPEPVGRNAKLDQARKDSTREVKRRQDERADYFKGY